MSCVSTAGAPPQRRWYHCVRATASKGSHVNGERTKENAQCHSIWVSLVPFRGSLSCSSIISAVHHVAGHHLNGFIVHMLHRRCCYYSYGWLTSFCTVRAQTRSCSQCGVLSMAAVSRPEPQLRTNQLTTVTLVVFLFYSEEKRPGRG